MLRSMFSGVSGLRVHQTKMDVIGNNIANVNTVGFKASNVTFQEIYNQTLKPASAPANTGGRGGTNPQQVGLGASIASIDVLHTRGSAQRTDKATDLAIDGEGFFCVSDGANMFFTRAGNFDIDLLGNLVSSNGMKVLGWTGKDAHDNIITTGEPGPINLSNLTLQPQASNKVTFQGNLDSRIQNGNSHEYSVSIFDSLGEQHKLKLTFTKENSSQNSWKLNITSSDPSMVIDDSDISLPIDLSFLNGKNATLGSGGGSFVLPSITFSNGANEITDFTLEFDQERFTQVAEESSVKASEIDGYRAGTLDSISIDKNGNVIGIYTNGQFRNEAVLSLAKFTNPSGLSKLGDNLFQNTTNSGTPELRPAGYDGRGMINPGALEMSNVDLAKEFTEMIITQRGFQSNSRIITTSDELLQELVNLKR